MQTAILLIIFILIMLYVFVMFYMLKQKPSYQNEKHTLVAVCSRGIYALCFAEGYVILTESITQARQVCVDLHLQPNPYWSQIVHIFPTQALAVASMKELETYIGPSAASFATLSADKLQIKFQGYISTHE